MVTRKGAGYALESIVAIATVFIFIFGALNIPANQDWSQFREQTSADDLTYTMQQSGYIDHALRNGETGSMQTAFSTVTERDIGVSGLVSNLPISENNVAFYVLDEDRYTQNLDEIESGDECEGDLEEITTRSEEPVLRSEGGDLFDAGKDNRTYVADLDPDTVGGNNKQDYDSLWIDNGTECQFSEAEGPYDIEEIFKWEDEYYDIKWIDGDSENMRLYQASQPVRFRQKLKQPVNSVKTFSSIDTVNFTRLDTKSYNIAIFRERESLDDVSANRATVEDFLQSGSILFLVDLDQSYFDAGDFLNDAGFKYVDVSYKSGYNGEETDGFFNENEASQDTETYFLGLEGQNNDISVKPSTKAISDTEPTIKSGRAIISSNQKYNFSEWNSGTENMNSIDPSSVNGEPESTCYSVTDRALTTDTISFPDSNYEIINAELGSSTSYCNNNNDRAIKIDKDDDGEYMDSDEGPFLNGESVIIDDREYGIDIIPAASDPDCDEGDCVDFIFIGDRSVELVPKRTAFPNLNGEKIALTGYEEDYSEQDLNLLASTVYWLRGDEVRFSTGEQSASTSTSTVSGIEDETYMPYEVNLRWNR